MIFQSDIEEVMQKRGLPYSKAKMLVEMYEREARQEGERDYSPADEGHAPKGASW